MWRKRPSFRMYGGKAQRLPPPRSGPSAGIGGLRFAYPPTDPAHHRSLLTGRSEHNRSAVLADAEGFRAHTKFHRVQRQAGTMDDLGDAVGRHIANVDDLR